MPGLIRSAAGLLAVSTDEKQKVGSGVQEMGPLGNGSHTRRCTQRLKERRSGRRRRTAGCCG